MNEHVTNLHRFYGAYLGARIARKHVGWYLDEEETGREFRKHFNAWIVQMHNSRHSKRISMD